MLTDAEVVTSYVAQAIVGIASDHRLARVAAKQLRHSFPDSVARMSPGYHDPLLLVDSTRSNARDLGRRSNAAATTASQTP
jgi:hypothetical protein